MQKFKRESAGKTLCRTLICTLAAAVMSCAFILKLGIFFSPGNIAEVVMGSPQSIEPEGEYISSDKLRFTLPSIEGLHKEEVYLIERDPKEETQETPSSGGYAITAKDLSSGAGAGEILTKDSDSGVSCDVASLLYSPYPDSLKNPDISKLSSTDAPLVLIIHTHATEAYTEEGVSTYGDGTSFRSSDPQKNMVAVGSVMTQVLNSAGVPTLHSETMYDKDDYNNSYPNSLADTKRYLEKYPSIKYVFDVHRDAIIKTDGELIKTVYPKANSAQVMIVVGTNAKGADHPKWLDNMNVACKLQNKLTTDYTGIARPINLRGASFNQQYAPGSLLFEIGSCGNTLNEAKEAAKILASELAELIKSN